MIDRALDRYIQAQHGHADRVWQAMRYGLFPGGKRIRPILTLASGEVFGGKQKELLPFACAIEMIHAYSLIHDDMPALDDDDLRRGEPTVHKVFGEGVALLAGDGLLTEAFNLISAPQVARSVPAELVLELIHEVAYAGGVAGIVGGQALDLEAENKEADLATVEYIHVRKTGALIRASLRVGARLAGATPGALRKISRFGEFLGLAFQIADDILDVQEAAAINNQGESGHKERSKATYPAVLGMVQARERLRELLVNALKELAFFSQDAEPLRALAHYVVGRAIPPDLKFTSEESHT
jgi:geranylgeranyl diphosphate synthase type II